MITYIRVESQSGTTLDHGCMDRATEDVGWALWERGYDRAETRVK